jgi:hypothetical protein
MIECSSNQHREENMKHQKLIADMLTTTANKRFQENQWGARHCAAWREPQGPEVGIVRMIEGVALYADHHAKRFESNVGEDGLLGPEVEQIIRSIRTLLNGECGRLDCGTLDRLLLDMLAAEGMGDE